MSWLKKLDFVKAVNRRRKAPWAAFTFDGPIVDNIIPVEFDYNEAFIKQLRELGFEGLDEEIIQKFMISLIMPKSMEDGMVTSEAHPGLTDDMHELRQG